MATTTINTIEDLVRVLDEHPEWLEALRTRLLTRELIELPRRFEEFAVSVDQRFVSVDQRFDEQGKVLAEHGEILAAHSEEFVGVKRELGLLRDDVGDLKGPRAEEETGKDIDFIAEQLGLTLTRVLTRDDLLALLPAQPLPNLPSKVRHSFTKADFVAEAVDESGETRYIAVEASYTVNGRDTDRAIRNAGILTQLTGKAAHAVVAGYRIDDRQRPVVESGEVYWHELEW